MSSEEITARCGFMGLLWVCVCVRKCVCAHGKRDRGIKRESVGEEGMPFSLQPLSRIVIYLATAGWWSEDQRSPTPGSDPGPAATADMDSAVSAKSTARQEG